MIRPEQHQTDSLGKALLRDVFARLDWTTNEITEDYGRDFDVEVFQNHQSTGIRFDAQLKSSVSPAYSAAREFISQELDHASAVYLARDLRQPALLIVADVRQRRIFWMAPQIDSALLQSLQCRGKAKTHTVRVPIANELPATVEGLISTLGEVQTVLASRRLMEVPIVDFASSVRGRIDTEALRQRLRDKSDFLDLTHAKELALGRDFEAARSIVRDVLSAEKSSMEMKFSALLVGEEVDHLAITRGGLPQAYISRLSLETALAMQRLTRKGPHHLKFYALLARIAGEFHVLAQQDYGMYLNWKAHETDGGDPWWRTGLIFERAELARRLTRKYNQFVRLARYAARSPSRWALPDALLRIIHGVSTLIVRVDFEGFKEAAEAYRASAFQFCKLAAHLARESNNDEALGRSAISAPFLTRDPASEYFRWASAEADMVRGKETRDWAHTVIGRQAQRLRGGAFPEDAYGEATEEQIYQNTVDALGVDLGNPDDELAQLVRIGIKDLDPTRVLRDCEHLFITLGARGLISEWLRLPTMGQKIIHCTLHKHSVGGLTLDDVYRAFRRRYCDKCPDRSPRPDSWRYSAEWQGAENERHKDYMETFRRPTPKLQPPPLPPAIQSQIK